MLVSDDELLGAWISTWTSELPGAELTTAWISLDIWIGGVPKKKKKKQTKIVNFKDNPKIFGQSFEQTKKKNAN